MTLLHDRVAATKSAVCPVNYATVNNDPIEFWYDV